MNQTLGRIIVALLLDDEQYRSAMGGAERDTQAFGQRLDAVAATAGRGFITAMKAAGTVVAALGTTAAVVGSQFEAQMDAIAAVRGITSDTAPEYAALEEKARSLGASTIFSATQAAEGMEMLARAGLSVEETIAASDSALALAAATGITMADSTSLIAASMAQFSIDASEANRIADVFVSTTQNSQFNAIEMAEAMKYAGTAGAAMGMSIEETSAAVAQFRNLGLDASMAGVQFRNVVTQLAKPSKQAEAALADLGMTVADVSLETHSFREVLLRLGQAGLNTEQAVAIFTKRSGTNMKALADRFAASTTEYDRLMMAIAESSGTAETAVGVMTDNVQGAFKLARSAAEELMLVLFDQFGPGLQRVLEAMQTVFNAMSAEVGSVSRNLSRGLGGALEDLADWLEDNAEMLAETFANAYEAVGDMAAAITRYVLPALRAIVPILDDIVFLMGLVWVVRTVMKFASALEAVMVALSATRMSVRTLFAEMTAMSGGTLALVAAVGTLVTGLIALAARFTAAEVAANNLAEAERRLKAESEDVARRRAAYLGELAQSQRESAAARLEELAAADKLTPALKAELEALRDLTPAQLAAAEAAGELVVVNGELRGVAAVVEELDPEKFKAMEVAIFRLGQRAQALAATEARLRALRNATLEMSARAADLRLEAEGFANPEALIAEIEAVNAERVQAEKAALNAAQQFSEAKQGLLAGEVNAVKDTVETTVSVREEGEKDAAFAALNVFGEFVRQRKAKHSEWLAEDNAEMLRQNAEIERILRLREADRDAFQARVADLVREAELRSMGEVERLEREKADVLAEIATASAEDRATIAADFDDRIAEARARHLEGLRRKLNELRDQRRTVWDFLAQGVEGFKRAVAGARETVSTIGRTMASLTGFDFGLGEGIQSIVDGVSAIESERKLGDQDRIKAMRAQAEAFVKGLVDKAMLFIQALVEGLPVLFRELAAAVPKVIEALIAALPDIIEALRVGLLSLIDALPGIIQMLADALPGIVRQLLLAVADVIVALVEALPEIVDSIVTMLPDLIEALIVTLMDALPRIIVAVVAAVPKIITSIVKSIPGIVRAIVQQLPLIITTLVGMIPDIIVALVSALPELLVAIVMLIPQVIIEIVKALPAIAKALWTSLRDLIVEGIPNIAKALWKAIKNAIAGIGDAIGGLFKKKDKDKSEGTAYMGIDYVPATMRVTAHEGDKITPPHRNPSRVPSHIADAGGDARGSQAAFGRRGGGDTNLRLLIDGRVVEEVLVRADQNGQGGRIASRTRRMAGVMAGVDPGRFNAWNN